jgi:hypothetical protein
MLKTVDPAFLQKQLDATPLNRFATPEDVADTVYALTTTLKFTTGVLYRGWRKIVEVILVLLRRIVQYKMCDAMKAS